MVHVLPVSSEPQLVKKMKTSVVATAGFLYRCPFNVAVQQDQASEGLGCFFSSF